MDQCPVAGMQNEYEKIIAFFFFFSPWWSILFLKQLHRRIVYLSAACLSARHLSDLHATVCLADVTHCCLVSVLTAAVTCCCQAALIKW